MQDDIKIETNDTEDIDKIIHEPARLKIILYLSMVEESDFKYLLVHTGLSKGNLSSHLSKLGQANYVAISKQFRDKIPCTMIRLTQKGRDAFREYKSAIVQLLDNISI